jgi:hypothetical protein
MRVILLLADSAQAVAGKLYILGGGWSIIGPEPSPMALAVKIEVPWDETNKKHEIRLELVDSDGHGFVPEGQDEPIVISAGFEVGRPPGVKVGTPIDLPFAVNLGPLPLKPDQRYEWRAWINDETDDDWRAAFTVRPADRTV